MLTSFFLYVVRSSLFWNVSFSCNLNKTCLNQQRQHLLSRLTFNAGNIFINFLKKKKNYDRENRSRSTDQVGAWKQISMEVITAQYFSNWTQRYAEETHFVCDHVHKSDNQTNPELDEIHSKHLQRNTTCIFIFRRPIDLYVRSWSPKLSQRSTILWRSSSCKSWQLSPQHSPRKRRTNVKVLPSPAGGTHIITYTYMILWQLNNVHRYHHHYQHHYRHGDSDFSVPSVWCVL